MKAKWLKKLMYASLLVCAMFVVKSWPGDLFWWLHQSEHEEQNLRDLTYPIPREYITSSSQQDDNSYSLNQHYFYDPDFGGQEGETILTYQPTALVVSNEPIPDDAFMPVYEHLQPPGNHGIAKNSYQLVYKIADKDDVIVQYYETYLPRFTDEITDFPGKEKIKTHFLQKAQARNQEIQDRLNDFANYDFVERNYCNNKEYVYQDYSATKVGDYVSVYYFQTSCRGEGHAAGVILNAETFDIKGDEVRLDTLVLNSKHNIIQLNNYWCTNENLAINWCLSSEEIDTMADEEIEKYFDQIDHFYLDEDGITFMFDGIRFSFADGPQIFKIPYSQLELMPGVNLPTNK